MNQPQYGEVSKLPFRNAARLVALCVIILVLVAGNVEGAETPHVKRVLILHSLGRDFAPFSALSSGFRTELARQSETPIEFLEASLETARFAEGGKETPFVEYLRALFAKRPPDLLVPFGAPAMNFLVRNRDHLFPGVPMVVGTVDRRRLKEANVGANATAVGVDLDLPGIIENILRILPSTKSIEVVIGNSPLEKFWLAELRRDFQSFTHRLRFTWLNELSFEEMRKRVATLPRDSAVLYAVLLVDAAGVPHEQERALDILRAESNAPLFGVFESQLGRGIVGGPLYPIQEVGRQSARLALRILNGESPGSIQPVMLGPATPIYDWRELKRWGISESRLPPGSVVQFRQVSMWEQYEWYIIVALILIVIQAAMIADLLLHRARRRRAEAELRESREFMDLATKAGELGLWVRDLSGNEVWANGPLRALLGLGENDPLRFGDMLAHVHPDDRPRVESQVQRAQEEGLPFEGEFRAVLPDGKERWVLAKGQAVADPRLGHNQRRVGVVFDITERKRAEEQLRESETRFRTVADTAPVMIWMSGTDKLCTFFNKSWLDFTGRSLGQELGNGWAEGVHRDDFGRCLEIYAKAFDARQEFTMEYRLRRSDGEFCWVLDNGVPRLDPDGTFLGYIGTCIDISERKRAEESVRESEKRIRILLETTNAIPWEADAKTWQFTYVGPQALKLLGYLPDRWREMDFWASHIHPDDREFAVAYCLDYSNRLKDYDFEYRMISADGRVVWIHDIVSVVAKDGAPETLRGFMIDVTERKQIEALLEQERSFLRQVIDIDPSFIFAKDREGRFTLVNQAVADAYGTTVENLIGKTDADFNPNREEVEFFHRMDLEVIDTLQERFIPEERITDAQGKVRWLQTVKRPIVEKDGAANQVLGASTDITKRKEIDAELRRQREELAHVTRISTMGELTASLAHELNQPLTAILSNAQAAQRFLATKPADLEEIKDILKDIVEDNSRAGEVIRRIRSLVKKEDIELARLDLPSVIRDVITLVHADASLRNIGVELECKDGLPSLRGDKVQLQQVVLNLLLNAFEAMKECPADEREVLVRVDSDGLGMLEVSVRDRGTGLTSAKLDKIFQPFFTTKRDGLGMGLSISRSIIEAHGGRLWAENNPESGATFYFTVPVEKSVEGT